MERMTQTHRREALCPHLNAVCMFTAPARQRDRSPHRLQGILAQLSAEGRLQ
jgi:hypothetical protein